MPKQRLWKLSHLGQELKDECQSRRGGRSPGKSLRSPSQRDGSCRTINMGELSWHKGSALPASGQAKPGPAPRYRRGTSCVAMSLTYSETFTEALERSGTAAVTRDTKSRGACTSRGSWILFRRGALGARGRRGSRTVPRDPRGDEGCQREEDFQERWAMTARQDGPGSTSPHQQVGTDQRTALRLLPDSL